MSYGETQMSLGSRTAGSRMLLGRGSLAEPTWPLPGLGNPWVIRVDGRRRQLEDDAFRHRCVGRS